MQLIHVGQDISRLSREIHVLNKGFKAHIVSQMSAILPSIPAPKILGESFGYPVNTLC